MEIHTVIIVTGRNGGPLFSAYDVARRYCENITGIYPSPFGDALTFVVLPDGAKAGSALEDTARQHRRAFLGWLDEQRYDDGSAWCSWVEVSYGQYTAAHVVASSDIPAEENEDV